MTESSTRLSNFITPAKGRPSIVMARIVLVAAVYAVLAWVALTLPIREGFLSPVWFAAGAALAAALAWGPIVVIGLFIADIGVSLWLGFGLFSATGFAVADSLNPLVTLLLVGQFGIRLSLRRIYDVLALLLAISVATIVSSGIGTLNLVASPGTALSDFGPQFVTYFTSVVIGNILITPFLLAWVKRWRLPRTWLRFIEGMAILVLTVGLCHVVFSGTRWHLLYLFLLFPVFTWASLRFGARGATGTALVAASLAIWATVHESVLINGLSDTQTAQVLQVMFGAVVVANLLLAATIAERNTALREGKEASDSLVRAQSIAHVGSWEWAPSTGMTWSPELIHLMNYGSDAATSSLDEMLARVHPNDREIVTAHITRAISDREGFELEHRLLRHDRNQGNRVVHHVVHVLSPDDRRRARRSGDNGDDEPPIRMIGTMLDITERKAAEQLKDAIITTASHELRTPLTSIVGFASTLMSGWDDISDADRLHFIGIIEDQGMRLADLVDDTLMQSNVDAGNVEAHCTSFSVRVVIDAALDTTDHRAIEVTCPSSLTAFATPRHIERVLVNLITNATKYGEPPIHIVAFSEPCPDDASGNDVVIQVIDHGPGVPPSFEQHLFERFTRGPNTDALPGSGLGLSISSGLIEANHGSLTYRRSRDDTRTEFEIRLPAAT